MPEVTAIELEVIIEAKEIVIVSELTGVVEQVPVPPGVTLHQILSPATNVLVAKVSTGPPTIIPVSYTHLDVYKRQFVSKYC